MTDSPCTRSSWKASPCLPTFPFSRRTTLALTFASRAVAFRLQPSARCSATAIALSSDTFVFHNAVAFLSLNSSLHSRQRNYRIASCPYILRTLKLSCPFCPYNAQRSFTHAKLSRAGRKLVGEFVFILPSYPAPPPNSPATG